MNAAYLESYSIATGILVARIILGVVFFFSGYDKVMRIGIPNVANEFERQLQRYHLPRWLFSATAIYSGWIELAGGLLLIIGLAKFAILPLLGIDLIMVTIAFSMLEPLWDMRIVLPRLLLLIFLFLTSTYFDYLSLDHLIFFKGNVPFSFS